MQVIAYLVQMNDKQKLIKDLIFGFTLAGEVIGTFVGAIIIGLYLDDVLSTQPILTFLLLILAFIQIIYILLKAGKR